MSSNIKLSADGLAQAAKKAVLGMALFIGVTSVAHCNMACMPAHGPTVEEQSYVTAIVACAATAGYPGAYDHASDMACRAKVDCQFKIGPC